MCVSKLTLMRKGLLADIASAFEVFVGAWGRTKTMNNLTADDWPRELEAVPSAICDLLLHYLAQEITASTDKLDVFSSVLATVSGVIEVLEAGTMKTQGASTQA